jgi:hypothetical protein
MLALNKRTAIKIELDACIYNVLNDNLKSEKKEYFDEEMRDNWSPKV